MSSLAFLSSSALSGIFTNEPLVIANAHAYLNAYAIDYLLTAVLLCFVGYFNGYGKTAFVMMQSVVGAFCARIPAVFSDEPSGACHIVSHQVGNADLFDRTNHTVRNRLSAPADQAGTGLKNRLLSQSTASVLFVSAPSDGLPLHSSSLRSS